MTKQQSRRIDFKEFAADLEHIFDSLEGEEELVIEKGGKTYRIEREAPAAASPTELKGDIWANYDPEKVLAALQGVRGILKGVDTEKLKADLRAARGQHPRRRRSIN